jgi:sugar/nucleoside kinase (ribokinase family)
VTYHIAGLGNALMDVLVVVNDDSVFTKLGLTRGTMHPVGDAKWQSVYNHFEDFPLQIESGGSCANTIATAGRLGANTIYCGQVGNDELGELYAKRITDACGQHALRFTEEHATGKCLSIISSSDAERTMVTDLGAATFLADPGPYLQILETSQIAHFTGYTLLDGPMLGVALTAIKAAKANGAVVSLDAADPFVVHATKDLLWDLLANYVDIILLNAEEAKALTGVSAEESPAVIAQRSCASTIVVKLGAAGSIILHNGETTRIGVHRVKAIDTTGAGDAYAGGLLYGISRGWSIERAGKLASRVAAMTVAQLGAVVNDSSTLRALIADKPETTSQASIRELDQPSS